MRETLVLNKTQINQSLVYAAKVLMSYKDEINKSNFIPVADGDTGTNLHMMMEEFIHNESKFLSATLSTEEKDLNLFNNSRGTIGLIFYEYFKEIVKDSKDSLTFNDLKEFFKIGYLNVFKSLNNPIEGSIISLMKALYLELDEQLKSKKEISLIIERCLDEVEKELNRTKKMIRNYAKVDGFDSGALAFYIFIDSFLNKLVNSKSEKSKYKHFLQDNKKTQRVKSNYQFSVLLTFKLVQENDHIFNKISDYGFVECISKIDNLYKVLIHTNEILELNNAIIHQINYLDVYIENLITKNKALTSGGNICILTDSIADLPIYFHENNHVFFIDLKISVNNSIYIDRKTIKNEHFYELVKNKKNKMTSLPPSYMETEYILNFLKTYYKDVIVLTVSNKLSETFNIMTLVAKKFDNKVHVINSKEASVSQGLVLRYGQQLIMDNNDVKFVISMMGIAIENARMLMICESLNSLSSSGKIKKTFGLMSKLLNLYPILSLDKNGHINHKTSVLNEQLALNYVINKLKKDHEDFGIISYGIAHSDNLKLAENIRKNLAKITGKEPVYITNLSSGLTMHTGIGSCVVGYIKNEIKKAI